MNTIETIGDKDNQVLKQKLINLHDKINDQIDVRNNFRKKILLLKEKYNIDKKNESIRQTTINQSKMQ